MKHVRCKSGLRGWQTRLKQNYGNNFELFQRYCLIYNIHTRLGYKTIKGAWISNPIIQGSVNPADFRKVKQ
jgi:hypothetical protein